jgi:hypothetical protein
MKKMKKKRSIVVLPNDTRKHTFVWVLSDDDAPAWDYWGPLPNLDRQILWLDMYHLSVRVL